MQSLIVLGAHKLPMSVVNILRNNREVGTRDLGGSRPEIQTRHTSHSFLFVRSVNETHNKTTTPSYNLTFETYPPLSLNLTSNFTTAWLLCAHIYTTWHKKMQRYGGITKFTRDDYNSSVLLNIWKLVKCKYRIIISLTFVIHEKIYHLLTAHIRRRKLVVIKSLLKGYTICRVNITQKKLALIMHSFS